MDQNKLLLMLTTLALILTTSVSTRVKPPRKQKPMRIQAKIMHRNAKGSPLHNPTATEQQIREEDFEIGRCRAEYMHEMSNINAVQADIAISESSFIMLYSIGTPPTDTYGYLDTGSSLSWIQCEPCKTCYKQKRAILYNPKDSSSFEYVTEDNNPLCRRNALWAPIIPTGDRCYYTLQYTDGTKTSGYLATETLLFLNNYAVNNIVFGCSIENKRKDFSPPGLVGLGNYSVSLVRQLYYNHFSYYLRYTESSVDMVGVIELGSPPKPEMKNSIPLIYSSTNSLYSLALESIDVLGNGSIEFPKSGIIIDTGSTYTLLERSIYNKLTSILTSRLGDPLSSGSGDICYEKPLVAPTITFRFTNYEMVLCESNLWYRNPFGRHCFAIRESPIPKSLLGMYQQRGLQVDFDLNKGYVNMDYVDHQCPTRDYD